MPRCRSQELLPSRSSYKERDQILQKGSDSPAASLLLILPLHPPHPSTLNEMGGAVTTSGSPIGPTNVFSKAYVRPLLYAAIAVWGALLYGVIMRIHSLFQSGSFANTHNPSSFLSTMAPTLPPFSVSRRRWEVRSIIGPSYSRSLPLLRSCAS